MMPDWIEQGMHVTNLGRREMPDDKAMDKFDVVVRQGTAGLQMRQTERLPGRARAFARRLHRRHGRRR